MSEFAKKTCLHLSWVVLIVSVVIFPQTVSAAPTVAGVTGAMSNGQSVTVTGTGFGSSGPTIIIFDDFEKGSSGRNISTSAGSAQVNNWTTNSCQGMPTYSNAYSNSGTLSLRSDSSTGESGQCARVTFAGTTSTLQSWWVYIPATSAWPAINWKTTWMGGSGSWPDNDYTATVYFYQTVDDSNAVFAFGCDDQGDGPGTRYGYATGGEWTVKSDLRRGRWVRHMMYATGSTSGGVAKYWETGPSGTRQILNDSGRYTMDAGHPWTWFHVPGFGGGVGSTSLLYYDDVYFATGDGAQARIEIGNNSTYSSCTNLAVMTPTSWSNTSITATFRQGSHRAGQTVYLFVVDSTGSVSTGYPLTIGGSDAAPTAPKNLTTIY
jgi:hypothetical protein